ncbi:phospholactate guanylyltransferase [Methanococcoides vulcani]|uniref:2-phospho-L-lactate guanylyltransferase n=1 Tax=Methanococcoides vulcani TaxID=1353158 RepID=A0A1H9Y9I1_9EURY|nr:2-phospho-L-lactate guanylyltransferase [Methanococcoides vulcani]SES65603.1 phospholactate guanylyltransferase [Methanococcoides vulcani]
MRAVIPYKKENAKSRLSPVLSQTEREEFVELMLRDVVSSLCSAGIKEIDILTTSREGVPDDLDLDLIVTDPGLNASINSYLQNVDEPTMIIMADLPLVRSSHIKKIISYPEDVVIVPGKGGGTNILFIRQPKEFTVKYHGCSFISHYEITEDLGKSIRIFDSFLASIDIDEPHDIVELLLYGNGLSKEYAEKRFCAETGKGRVKISPLSKLSGFI